MKNTANTPPHPHLLPENQDGLSAFFGSLGMQTAAIMLSTTCHKLTPPEKESANYKKGFAECKKRMIFALLKMEKQAEENASALNTSAPF